jgi:hypothetical protein
MKIRRHLRITFLGDEILRQQFLVALFLSAQVLELRLSLREVGLGLRKLRLVGFGIELEQQGALGHVLAVAHEGPDDLAVHARLHRHRGDGFDIADGVQPQRHALLDGLRDQNGNCGRCLLRLGLRIVLVGTAGERAGNDQRGQRAPQCAS